MNAEEFLKQKTLFQLGDLPTETPHPKTARLSEWSQDDLPQAIRVMREIDLEVLHKMLRRFDEFRSLFHDVREAVREGRRIYLVGCGATGRLSLSLEYLWRKLHPGSDQVISLMAGGDVALVHSLEGFEDFPEYGARHLRQLGFGEDDLLIGTTEGGETPYVIGAVEEAARVSKRAPYFMYCNTREILIQKVERSRRVLQNPRIHSLCLETGPMALTGSTRMQATTVLMLVAGLALLKGDWAEAKGELETWIRFLETQPIEAVQSFILRESDTYKEGGFSLYSVDDFAITVFTDTTERAPTFNLAPFDNPGQPGPKPSLTYISIPTTGDAASAWRFLLGHEPRPLNWREVHPKTTKEYLLSFDFSRRARDFRESLAPRAPHFEFAIEGRQDMMSWRFRGVEEHFTLSGQNVLFDHLTLKMLLNMHSTLVLGRLGRFEGNLMTWVYPSNGKLVDRAARYTQILLKQKGILKFDYDSIVRAQFECKAKLSPKESIVHKTMEYLLAQEGSVHGVER